jgi:hypothetical protein
MIIPPYQLKVVSGAALILFLDDNLEIFEHQATQFCHDVSQLYQCYAWQCHVWDAIFIDINNTVTVAPTHYLHEFLQQQPFPSVAVEELCGKIKRSLYDYMPSVVRHSGYFLFDYCEFVDTY